MATKKKQEKDTESPPPYVKHKLKALLKEATQLEDEYEALAHFLESENPDKYGVLYLTTPGVDSDGVPEENTEQILIIQDEECLRYSAERQALAVEFVNRLKQSVADQLTEIASLLD